MEALIRYPGVDGFSAYISRLAPFEGHLEFCKQSALKAGWVGEQCSRKGKIKTGDRREAVTRNLAESLRAI